MMQETCRYCKEDWTEHIGIPCTELEKKDETKIRLALSVILHMLVEFLIGKTILKFCQKIIVRNIYVLKMQSNLKMCLYL